MLKHFHRTKRGSAGFSLIELLIVVAIILILAKIAFPSYRTYLQKSRRTDAIAALINLEAAQENYRFNHMTYGTLAELQASITGISGRSALGYYTLTVPANGGTSYTLTATAIGTQTSDTSCTTMSIAVSAGVETKTPTTCWSGS